MNFSFGLGLLGVLFFDFGGGHDRLDEVGPTAELLALGVFLSLKNVTNCFFKLSFKRTCIFVH